ncbi:MAG TPA: hypothetical protein VJT73_07465, partial [Polyangiaceae bacterium]|nr:hypothetical protein [Polyangiaceae bacterium]
EGVKMRFTFDADHVGDRPGALSTSDGLFVDAAMRPIPQLSHDPLFTFDFGEGRDKNLLYAVDPNSADGGPTVMVVLSFMHTGEAEVRLFRGAPSLGETGAPSPGDGAPIFAVFAPMVREVGTCSF